MLLQNGRTCWTTLGCPCARERFWSQRPRASSGALRFGIPHLTHHAFAPDEMGLQILKCVVRTNARTQLRQVRAAVSFFRLRCGVEGVYSESQLVCSPHVSFPPRPRRLDHALDGGRPLGLSFPAIQLQYRVLPRFPRHRLELRGNFGAGVYRQDPIEIEPPPPFQVL